MKFAQPKLSPTDRIGLAYDLGSGDGVHTKEFDSLEEARQAYGFLIGPISSQYMNTTTYSENPECFEKFEATVLAGEYELAAWLYVVV